MKKQMIAIIVSAILLFLWQFLSWTVLGIHQAEFKYTANQDKILEFLAENLGEEGTYMLPGVPPGTPMDQEQTLMQPYEGKPWAQISYHPSLSMAMGMNLLRGLLVDAIAAFLLVWLLMQFEKRSLQKVVMSSIAVGLIGYFFITYSNSIWFETKSFPYLIDAVVAWGLNGLWLGWWLNRN